MTTDVLAHAGTPSALTDVLLPRAAWRVATPLPRHVAVDVRPRRKTRHLMTAVLPRHDVPALPTDASARDLGGGVGCGVAGA